jgi:ribosome-associated protein
VTATPATLRPLTSLEQARRTAALAAEKLAENVVILDMRPACVYTDYFVIATGRNPRQTKAIFDEVYAQLKRDAGLTPRATDGAQEGNWIIADYLDVVLHIFTPETRDYYRLEDLWGDLPAVELEAATA